MKVLVSEVRVKIRSLVETGEYTRALSELRKYRIRDLRHFDLDDISEFLYFESRCLYHLGEYRKAAIRIRAALRVARNSTNHSLYATEKQLLGVILAACGFFVEAIEAYNESYVYRRRSGELDRLYGPLTNIGLSHFAGGNLLQAEDSFDRALRAAATYNSEKEVNLCRLNLARVQWLKGAFRDSLHSLSLISCEQLKRFAELVAAQVEASRCNCGQSRTLLYSSLKSFTASAEPRELAICYEFLGLNEYFAGNYAKAREYYDQVLAMPEPTASAVAQTLRMLTDVEIAEGNWDAAKATAARADVAINKISERIELGALWRAYGHIHTHDNDHAKARECFEKSIDLLRQLGARYELALSHFDAGRSKAFTVEAQVEQLKAAKALFVEMEVPKRVAQVDEALGKIASLRAGNSDKTKRSLTLKSAPAVPVVIAVSHSMTGIMELADQIKNNDMTVLITGETGTGKDLLAEYIHSTGNRCGSPFKAINCAAMPESLLEMELFGVKKGTFTGSTSDKPGLIESADGGTFYFDEIGDAPATIQSKLLRAIETKTVRRLGANEDVRVNVRFIAATNHNLQERIASREFRRDLYYRIAEVEITLPPLRDRREDVMPLISQFLKAEKVELTTEQYLQLDLRVNGYDWPGNVREVRRLVKLATATNSNGELIPALEHALNLLNHTDMTQSKTALIELLDRHHGNIASAARELDIPRSTLVSHLKKFGLL